MSFNTKIDLQTLNGNLIPLSHWDDKVLLIVNVASQCGFTPQYTGLEELHQEFSDKGLVILAFPCNQFGGQEPGTAEEIQKFCTLTYPVSFPIMAKCDVNGDNAHPLWKELKSEAPGILNTEAIKWNFTKFLVSKDRKTIERFAPNTVPKDLIPRIEALLA